MCGICFAKSLRDKPVKDILEERYQAQRSRGTDGFGYLEVNSDGVVSNHSTSERLILKSLRESTAREVLFHHRFPTSTDNVISACHPFFSKAKDGRGFFLVHNGVLSNDDKIRKEHEEKYGIEYSSVQANGDFNDSECLVHELMLFITKEKDTFECSGSIAFVAVETDEQSKPVKLHFARNSGSPLKMLRTRNTIQIASTGDGVDVHTNHLYTMDYETMKVSEIPFVMKTYEYSSGYSTGYGYDWSETIDDDDYVSGRKSIWKPESQYHESHQPKLLSIREQIEQDLEDEAFDRFAKSFEESSYSRYNALPVPPLLSLDKIYSNFMENIDFVRGLEDGEYSEYTRDDYKWITQLVLKGNREIKELNELKEIATSNDKDELIEIEFDIIDKSKEFLYWIGVATRMYELSTEV